MKILCLEYVLLFFTFIVFACVACLHQDYSHLFPQKTTYSKNVDFKICLWSTTLAVFNKRKGKITTLISLILACLLKIALFKSFRPNEKVMSIS